MAASDANANPLLVLLGLMRRAREAKGADELAFLLVNDSRALASYRQAVLWWQVGGVRTLSGVVQPEANAPYVQWVEALCAHLLAHHPRDSAMLCAADVPKVLADAWADWLPAHALWLPMPVAADSGPKVAGGWILAGDHAWDTNAIALLQEWTAAWAHVWQAQFKPPAWSLHQIRERLHNWWQAPKTLPWWRRSRTRLLLAVAMVLVFPVRLSLLAPGELVPAHPAVIRAPLDGVIGQIHVSPNAHVKAGQVLFSFDEAQLAARRDVAEQALGTAQMEYRQFAQQALSDMKSKSQLSLLLGKIEERRAEAHYLSEQLVRSQVVAPMEGTALFDDPTDWIGKPVQTGERVMRITAVDDVEIEVWVPLGDAIELPPSATVQLYLSANPLSSISAKVRYMSQEAQLRPNGVYAYRLRATPVDKVEQRVGLKGTAKVAAGWVPLVYWVLRRPLATIRQTLGI